jgi:hypothetical protein
VYTKRFVFFLLQVPLYAGRTKSVAAAIKNLATTSSRGGLGKRSPKSRRHQPHDEVGIARTKRFIFFPCTSDSYSTHKIGSCRNQKTGDDKFKRRPQRMPPPQILTSPASRRGGNHTHKKIRFFSSLQL